MLANSTDDYLLITARYRTSVSFHISILSLLLHITFHRFLATFSYVVKNLWCHACYIPFCIPNTELHISSSSPNLITGFSSCVLDCMTCGRRLFIHFPHHVISFEGCGDQSLFVCEGARQGLTETYSQYHPIRAINLSCRLGGNWSTLRKHTPTRGEHTNFTKKGLGIEPY